MLSTTGVILCKGNFIRVSYCEFIWAHVNVVGKMAITFQGMAEDSDF